jgi:uncharacterized protein (DUF952 family)
MPVSPIYHICPHDAWQAARAAGVYRGGPLDARDGFIHCSAADQVAGTLRTHLAGQAGLVLLEIDPAALGDALVWEAARAGAAFPHLYGDLPVTAVVRVHDLPLLADGRHRLPAGIPDPGPHPDRPGPGAGGSAG